MALRVTDFNYYRKIDTSSASTDYQIKLTLWQGNAGKDNTTTGNIDLDSYTNASGDWRDIAFGDNSDPTAANELSYWVEDTGNDGTYNYAIVWIKLNSTVATNNYFYVFYESSTATDNSSGTNTFIFFEDFEGTTLPAGWTESESYGSYTMNGDSTITIQNATGYKNETIETTTAKTVTNTYLEFKVQRIQGNYNAPQVYTKDDISGYVIKIKYHGAYNAWLVDVEGDNGNTIYSFSDDTNWRIARIRFGNGSGIRLSIHSIDYTELGSYSSTASFDATEVLKLTARCTSTTVNSFKTDWVRLRKYSTTEPSYNTFNTEQEVSSLTAPVVSNRAATGTSQTNTILCGVLDDNGGTTSTCYIYFGNTDGGTTPSDWDNAINMGTQSEGVVYTYEVTSWGRGDGGYFRNMAYNSVGTSWANSTSWWLTAPGNASAFSASATTYTRISLSWTNGVGGDGLYIEYTTGTNPSTWNPGDYNKLTGAGISTDGYVPGSSFTHTVNPGTQYYYKGWAYAEDDNKISINTSYAPFGNSLTASARTDSLSTGHDYTSKMFLSDIAEAELVTARHSFSDTLILTDVAKAERIAATEYTKHQNLDMLLKKIYSKSTAADVVVQKDHTKTLVDDIILKISKESPEVMDLIADKLNMKTTITDLINLKLQEISQRANITLDEQQKLSEKVSAIVNEVVEKVLLADIIIKQLKTTDAVADVVVDEIKKALLKTDLALNKPSQVNKIIDIVVRDIRQLMFETSLAVERQASVEEIIDVAVAKVNQLLSTANIVTLTENELKTVVNLIIESIKQTSNKADIVIGSVKQTSNEADVVLESQNAKNAIVNAILDEIKQQTLKLDMATSKTIQVNKITDVVIESIKQVLSKTDMIINKQRDVESVIDLILAQANPTTILSTDVAILTENELQTTIDVITSAVKQALSKVDIVLKNIFSKNEIADIVIEKIQQQLTDADIAIKDTKEVTEAIDIFIGEFKSALLDIDVAVLRQQSSDEIIDLITQSMVRKYHVADVVLKEIHQRNMSISQVLQTIGMTIQNIIDLALMKPEAKLLQTSPVLRKLYAKTLINNLIANKINSIVSKTDTILQKEDMLSLNIQMVLKALATKSQTVDMVLNKEGSEWVTLRTDIALQELLKAQTQEIDMLLQKLGIDRNIVVDMICNAAKTMNISSDIIMKIINETNLSTDVIIRAADLTVDEITTIIINAIRQMNLSTDVVLSRLGINEEIITTVVQKSKVVEEDIDIVVEAFDIEKHQLLDIMLIAPAHIIYQSATLVNLKSYIQTAFLDIGILDTYIKNQLVDIFLSGGALKHLVVDVFINYMPTSTLATDLYLFKEAARRVYRKVINISSHNLDIAIPNTTMQLKIQKEA